MFILLAMLVALSGVFTLTASAPAGVAAHASAEITVQDSGVAVEFPQSITFNAHIVSPAGLDRVVIEYGVKQITCGTVTAKAFPDFQQGAVASDVSWTWDMRQSGSEPPGAQIWYRWHITQQDGSQRTSEIQTAIWLDQSEGNNWQSLEGTFLVLHSRFPFASSFAKELLTYGEDALKALEATTGVKPQAPIHVYIYNSMEELQASVLYQPGWTGGLAYAEYDIVLIAIYPFGGENFEWGKQALAHELTHVLVGHLTFSCLVTMPTWLNEGLAMYGQGGLDPTSEEYLRSAIAQNQLLPLGVLTGGFSEQSDRADLSYSESYSIVNFLITRFGRDKILQLLGRLRDGVKVEDALRTVYGFGQAGLEKQWREYVGAPAPRHQEAQESDAAQAARQLPTPVPTYPMLAGPASARAVQPGGSVYSQIDYDDSVTATVYVFAVPLVAVLMVVIGTPMLAAMKTYVAVQRKRRT